MVRRLRRAPALLAALAGLLALPAVAEAHLPRFLDATTATPAHALVLPDPEISFAIYGRLERTAVPAAYVRVAAPADLVLHVELIVPVTERTRVVPRRLRITGPGGFRRDLHVPRRASGTFSEEFTQTSYRRHLATDVRLGAAGSYRIEVASIRGRALNGRLRYVLVTGVREEASAAELAALPAALVRIQRWYREA